MATLFKTLDEVKEHIRLQATIKLVSLQPYENDAVKKYVEPYLGDEAFSLLQTEYTDDDLSAANEALLPYVQKVLSRFMVYLASPGLDIQLGETGFQTASTNNFVPASKERVKKFDDSIEKLGYDAVETLLAFLEDNEDDYSEWTSSSAYTMATKNFVNSAIDFNDNGGEVIERSRLKFMKLRGTIENVERLQIYPIISEDLASEIITEIRDNDLSTANSTLLPKIKRAVVNISLYEAGYGEKYNNLGQHYLSKLLEFLDDNVSDYPLYEASDSYDDERDSYEQFKNNDEDESGLFIFGSAY